MASSWFLPLLGGALIGVGASLLLIIHGRVAGISGMVANLLAPSSVWLRPQVLFLVGLLLAGALALAWDPSTIAPSPRPLAWLAASGLLVGLGTRLGNGCTSGHGVCGTSRFSLRSIVATLTFVATGMMTVTFVRLLGGAP
jgi:uncharacterized membrane protein YedE/YeeE